MSVVASAKPWYGAVTTTNPVTRRKNMTGPEKKPGRRAPGTTYLEDIEFCAEGVLGVAVVDLLKRGEGITKETLLSWIENRLGHIPLEQIQHPSLRLDYLRHQSAKTWLDSLPMCPPR